MSWHKNVCNSTIRDQSILMNNLDLSIIIVSFNTKDLLRETISSIYKTANKLSYEIIVVDNASSDGSTEMIETEFKEVTVIKNSQNTGFAKANNQGIKVSTGRYLLLLNSDTILKEGSVEKLAKFMDEHPQAAAVGPKVLNFDGSLQSKGFCFPSVLFTAIILLNIPKFISDKKLLRWFPQYYWEEDDVRQIDWISGCCMFLKREAVENIGGLSGDFFMYHEDEEWCYRARRKGYEIWYLPTAEIIHHNMSSPLSNRSEVGLRSSEIFFKKTIGRIRSSTIALMYCLSFTIKLIRLLIIPRGINEYQDTIERLKNGLKVLKYLVK